MSLFLSPNGTVSITLTATQKVAVWTQGLANVYRTSAFPNYPATTALLGTVINGQTVFGTYTGGATIQIEAAGGLPVLYEIGTDPVVQQWRTSNSGTQVTPIAKTVAVTLTAAEITTGLVTGTHTAGATAAYTLPTGALLDASTSFVVDEYFDWTVINLSAAAADTITITSPGADHTVVGTMICQSAHSTTGTIHGNALRMRTRKTAANTFVTYRLS
jgi:hypothetical protein